MKTKLLVLLCACAVGLGQFLSRSVSELHGIADVVVEELKEHSVHLGGIREDGLNQPFADRIRIAFSVPSWSRSFSFDMRVMDEIFDHESVVTFDHGDGNVETVPHKITTYVSEYDAEDGYATATINDDGTISMTVFGPDAHTSFQVAPVHHHQDDMEPEHYEEMKKQHSMVLHTLGSLAGVDYNLQEDGSIEMVHSQSGRQLLQRFPTVSERWVGCHGGSATDEFTFKLGIAVDLGYYKVATRNGGNVQNNIAQLVATMNQVYRPELGVILQLGETEIKTSATNDAWNQDRGTARYCALNIDQTLDNLDTWRRSTRSTSAMGAWHLLTDCYPPPGTVGLAYVGSLCQNGNNVGVNTFSGTSTWLTLAHELGHNFGAGHSFELGQGTTGGIMDYGDGTLNGVYTFNKRFREADICPRIRAARTSTRVIRNCFTLSTGGTTPSGFTGTWSVGAWSTCSQPCGLQGVQTRILQCRNVAGAVIDAINCDPTTKPIASQACNRIMCPSPTSSGDTTCTCANWGNYSSCANSVRTRARICTPELVCFLIGEPINEVQICFDGSVAVRNQVWLQISRPWNSIANVENFKSVVEAELPALLGMPFNQAKVTGIEASSSGSTEITFYVLTQSAQDVRIPLADAAVLPQTMSETFVNPDVIVAAALRDPSMEPLGGNVEAIRPARNEDFANNSENLPSEEIEDNGSAKRTRNVFIGIGFAVGAVVICVIIVFSLIYRRRKWASATLL